MDKVKVLTELNPLAKAGGGAKEEEIDVVIVEELPVVDAG